MWKTYGWRWVERVKERKGGMNVRRGVGFFLFRENEERKRLHVRGKLIRIGINFVI